MQIISLQHFLLIHYPDQLQITIKTSVPCDTRGLINFRNCNVGVSNFFFRLEISDVMNTDSYEVNKLRAIILIPTLNLIDLTLTTFMNETFLPKLLPEREIVLVPFNLYSMWIGMLT